MGVRLSHPHREVYLQVKVSLKLGNGKFSRGDLKHFVRWIFFHFPSVSIDLVHSLEFWDKVGNKLTLDLRVGGVSVSKFLPLLVLICASLEKKRKGSGLGSPVVHTPLFLPLVLPTLLLHSGVSHGG